MKKKILVAMVGILFGVFQLNMVYAAGSKKKCKPPKEFKKYCNQIKQAVSGGGGAASKNSGNFNLKEKGKKTKYMDSIFNRPDTPKSYQDIYKVCKDGIKELDKQCNGNPSSESCHKRNAYRKEMNQIAQSFNPRTNKSNNVIGSGEDDYISSKDLVKSLRGEMDPGNWKRCKDEESRKKNGNIDPEKTAQKLQDKKNSPTNSQFKSKRVALPSKNGNVNEQNASWEDDLKEKEGKNNPQTMVAYKNNRSLAFLQNFFLGKSFAAGDKTRGHIKNIEKRLKSAIKHEYGPGRAQNKNEKNEIYSNRNVGGGGFINALQSGFDQHSEMKKHNARMSNDIQGEGMAATQERFEKSMDMHKNSIKELEKTLEAIAFICQNQAASTKCFGDSNTLPQLPFPFGGGAERGGSSDTISLNNEDYPFVARYFCPNKDEDFLLTTKKGIWGSTIVVSSKGISISDKRPLEGFEFHKKGCLVSIYDDARPEKFQIYETEPKFYKGVSNYDPDLMFFLPKNAYTENKIIYGVNLKERSLEHLFNYLEERQDQCTPYKLNLGQFITAIGYPLDENDLELNRKIEKSEGFMTDSSQEETIERSFSISAKLKHEGFSGGAIIKDLNKCFVGIPFIRKISNTGFKQRMIPLPEILKFIEVILIEDAS